MNGSKNDVLKPYSYFATGGACKQIHEPESSGELAEILQRLHRDQGDYFLLGAGSNSLVMDERYEGEVILFHKLSQLSVESNRLHAGAGIENTAFSEFAWSQGLTGAGWMNRLPGQIGATVRMNARCYGGEVSQIVREIEVVTEKGAIKTYQNSGSDIFRGYKDTMFMGNGDVITGIVAELAHGDLDETRKLMDHCESDRVGKSQFNHPTCGCVFKNNYQVGVSSGLLLDLAKVKSLSVGGAVINPDHANFVFNQGAGSRDILELTFLMREAVYREFGAWLEYEMEILGTMPEDLRKEFDRVRPMNLDEKKLAPIRERFQKSVKGNQL